MKNALLSFLLLSLFESSFNVCQATLPQATVEPDDGEIIVKMVRRNLRTGHEQEIDLKLEMLTLSAQVAALRKTIDPVNLEKVEQGAEFRAKYNELLTRFSGLLSNTWRLSGDALKFGYDFSIFFAYDVLYSRVIPGSMSALDRGIELVNEASAIIACIVDQISVTTKPSPKVQLTAKNDQHFLQGARQAQIATRQVPHE